MSKFLTDVQLQRYVDQENTYQLLSNLVFEYQKLYRITVYSGFNTDGASVPKLLRWYIDPYSGKYLPSAIIHDALYRSQILSREESDLIFYEGMLVSGVSKTQAEIMFQALNFFGYKAWNNNKKNINFYLNYISIESSI